MITTSDIETLVRSMIHDPLQGTSDIFDYSISSTFTLQEDYVSTVTDVLVNQVSSGTEYSFDSDTNKIEITSSLTVGDSIEVIYTFYSKYASTEVAQYIDVALAELAIRNFGYYEVFDETVYPDITRKEKYLIAAVTAILMEPNNREIRTPDMTIKPPSGSMSTAKQIDRILMLFKKNSSGIFTL